MSATLTSETSGEPAEPGGEPYSPRPGGDPGLRVTLNLETPDCDPPLAEWLGPLLAQVAAEAGVTRGTVHLCVVNDARMSELHGRFLNQAETTDVLSFDLRDSHDDPLEGDIVICRDVARRQALRHGHDARLEILLYAVHGLLHLIGHGDSDPKSFDEIHRIEDDLLRRVGIGPVFFSDHRNRIP